MKWKFSIADGEGGKQGESCSYRSELLPKETRNRLGASSAIGRALSREANGKRETVLSLSLLAMIHAGCMSDKYVTPRCFLRT